jgi:hypothetical protein
LDQDAVVEESAEESQRLVQPDEGCTAKDQQARRQIDAEIGEESVEGEDKLAR